VVSLAAVKWGLVALGAAAGALITTVASLLFWAVLAAVGVEEAPLAGLTAALILGFTAAGFAAGRLAPYFHRFHGSLAGFGLAALVVVVAIAGGSPAPTPQVLLAAGFGIVLGGLGGVLGGRRRPDAG
jgi:putative membrane protein (TIGR04086 family)